MAKSSDGNAASYGACDIHHFSPERNDNWPKVINAIVSFEDALKLNLFIQRRLHDISKKNRATKAGKQAAVKLSIFTDTDKMRLMVNPGSTAQHPK